MPDDPVSSTARQGEGQEPKEVEKPLRDIESGGQEDIEPEPFIQQELPPDA